ncbi:MAG: T9SS type A sorting domain-containing protein [Candidatus Cloacimonetes bacterium]|nr:T9SS type A sorting domain-containing protein [Candidatus Cloacimonadota bacterium]
MKNALTFDFAKIVRNAQNTHSGDTLQKMSFLHYFSVSSPLLPNTEDNKMSFSCKIVIMLLALITLASCAVAPDPSPKPNNSAVIQLNSSNNSRVNINTQSTTPVVKQNSIDIASSLIKAADQAFKSVNKNQPIAIVHMSAPNTLINEFLLEELQHILVDRGFTVVERRELDHVRTEQAFQLDWEVDDRTAVSIGRFVGANAVVTGSLSGIDIIDKNESSNIWDTLSRLRLKVIDTETAIVIGTASEHITSENLTVIEIATSQDEYTPIFTIEKTELLGNDPNPFNPSTTIFFNVNKEQIVNISIFNIRGRIVRTLVNTNLIEGSYSVEWDGKNDSDRILSSGVYFYRMNADNFSETRRMVLMR